MTDPQRLADGGDLGGDLLRSARTFDAARARERKAAILGAAAAAASASTMTAATAATLGARGLFSSALLKWGAIGIFTALAGLAAVRIVGAGGASPRSAGAEAHAEAAAASPPLLAAAETKAAPTPTARALTPDDLPSTETTEPKPAARAPAADLSADADPAATLAGEVAALRVAREALGGGQAARALAALDAYSARYPAGHLGLEAEVLRIEALSRSGGAAAAATRARAFLAAHPTSPYAHRVRALAQIDGEGATGSENP